MFELLKKIADGLSIFESFTIISGLFVTLITLYWFIQKKVEKEQEKIAKEYLNNDADVSTYLDEIDPKLKYERSTYKNFLRSILDWLDELLGKHSLFSYKALDKHIIYSLIYSFFFFYMVWLFGGDGKIGTLDFMGKEDRVTTTLFLVFEILFLYYYLTNIPKIITFIKNNIPYISRLSNDWLEILLVVVVGVVGGVVGGVVVVNGINPNTILLLLFFLILPLINALFDYISMYFSRFFAQRILKDSKSLIVIDILLDLTIAVVLLVSLAFTLYFIVDITNLYIIKDPLLQIPIESYKIQLLENHWSQEVLWITLMFISTLIPTLLHIILALFSFVADYFFIKPHLHLIYEQLEHHLINGNRTKREQETLAKNLAYYELSPLVKWAIFGAMSLFILLSLATIIFAIKIA